VKWLALSIVLSVVLTVVLNLAIRLWPDASDRAARQLDDWADRQNATEFGDGPNKVRVVIPWKAMLLASLALTILVNLLIRLA
jgi:hypothetical protein